MFASAFSSSPALAMAAAFRSVAAAMTVQFRHPDPAHRAPRISDIRHLDAHMLKDIGYAREDGMSASARDARDRLALQAYR
ncbi:hypothetical protein [Tropicimonas marinistellae]|uniref:hypothetical protein n=1 Tax=Tropicimonas marinistellae TaxID=1739787 RepID=UPI000835CC8D|nr:hypothetical protein [Tropicimonas marinistellae]